MKTSVFSLLLLSALVGTTARAELLISSFCVAAPGSGQPAAPATLSHDLILPGNGKAEDPNFCLLPSGPVAGGGSGHHALIPSVSFVTAQPFSCQAIPEPSFYATLLGLAVFGVVVRRRKIS